MYLNYTDGTLQAHILGLTVSTHHQLVLRPTSTRDVFWVTTRRELPKMLKDANQRAYLSQLPPSPSNLNLRPPTERYHSHAEDVASTPSYASHVVEACSGDNNTAQLLALMATTRKLERANIPLLVACSDRAILDAIHTDAFRQGIICQGWEEHRSISGTLPMSGLSRCSLSNCQHRV